jgi:hypothetical protein
MARIALVGYEPILDFIAEVLPVAGHEVVSKEIVTERDVPLEVAVERMLKSGPHVMHYVGFKDSDQPKRTVDRDYISAVLKVRSDLQIILSSCTSDAREYALQEGIYYIDIQTGKLTPYFALVNTLIEG